MCVLDECGGLAVLLAKGYYPLPSTPMALNVPVADRTLEENNSVHQIPSLQDNHAGKYASM